MAPHVAEALNLLPANIGIVINSAMRTPENPASSQFSGAKGTSLHLEQNGAKAVDVAADDANPSGLEFWNWGLTEAGKKWKQQTGASMLYEGDHIHLEFNPKVEPKKQTAIIEPVEKRLPEILPVKKSREVLTNPVIKQELPITKTEPSKLDISNKPNFYQESQKQEVKKSETVNTVDDQAVTIQDPSRAKEAWTTLIKEGLGALIAQTKNIITQPNKGSQQIVKSKPREGDGEFSEKFYSLDKYIPTSEVKKYAELQPVTKEALGDTIHNYQGNPNRYIVPVRLKMDSLNFGVRSRGEQKDIDTEGAVFTPYKRWDSPKKVERFNFNYFLSYNKETNKVSIINREAIYTPEIQDNSNLLITGTYGHLVKDVSLKDGEVNPGIGTKTLGYTTPSGEQKSIKVFGVGSGKELGGYYGGKVIITKPDGSNPELIYGSGEMVMNEFYNYKKRNNVDYAIILEADGKAYAQTFQTKNKKITKEELTALDNLNSFSAGSGNILYLK